MIFKQWDCTVYPGYYENGRKALRLVDEGPDPGPVATATVNLVDEDCPDDCAFIKDYSENVGMTDALIKADLIEPELLVLSNQGFIEVGLYRLTQKALDLFE